MCPIRRILVSTLLLPFLIVGTCYARDQQFFGGERGQLINLLRRADKASATQDLNTVLQEALNIHKKVKSINDEYLLMYSNMFLSVVHQKLGNQDKANLHADQYLSTMKAIFEKEGGRKLFINMMLINYDLQIYDLPILKSISSSPKVEDLRDQFNLLVSSSGIDERLKIAIEKVISLNENFLRAYKDKDVKKMKKLGSELEVSFADILMKVLGDRAESKVEINAIRYSINQTIAYVSRDKDLYEKVTKEFFESLPEDKFKWH